MEADNCVGRDVGQWGQRQCRYSKEETSAADMWDGNKRYLGQYIWRFLDKHDIIDALL